MQNAQMLCEASVGELKRDRIGNGQIVICMRHYPRFLKRNPAHLYVRALAPADALFRDFRAALERLGDHDKAFDEVRYEERFDLSPEGRAELERLSELARKQDVFLICQCEKREKCHRHLLMLIAEKLYGAPIDRVRNNYPIFEQRLVAGF